MNPFNYFKNPRVPKIVFVLVLFFALVCTQIPLFNYLGFEFSALTAVVVGFFSGLSTISLWNRIVAAQPGVSPDAEEAIASPDERIWKFLKSQSAYLGILCLVPAGIMTANAVFVKNCSFSQGLIFYSLLVLPGVFFCSMVALCISVSVRWKKTWFVSLYLLLLAHILFVTFTRPQIFAFNPIIGFFPGITYDETMPVEGRLVLYRWATVSAALLLFLASVIMHRWKERKNRGPSAQSSVPPMLIQRAELTAGIVLVVIVSGVFLFSEKLGFSSSESFVESQLGGKIETEHFIVFYPANAVNEGQARQLAQLHEFYYYRHAQELRLVSVKKIHSFLYASAEQKGRLIGAGRTNIAKPWLWQIHLNLGDVETSLKHEMVHVLAADFGFPLIRVGLNPGLIEGLATAVERYQYDEPLHEVAAQIFSVGIIPDMKRLFSFSGFAGTYPAVSYSLAGSFCRYLIDQYGIRRFKRLYRSGDFRAIYNKDVGILLSEWKQHLERYRVSPHERQKAEYLFKRASIFGRECARVIANLNAETRRSLARRDYRAALETASQSLELSKSPEAIFQRMNALLRLGQYEEAAEFAEEHLSDAALSHTLLPLKLQLGDAHWALGDHSKARRAYEDLLSTHISLTTDEACALRLEVLADTSLSQNLRQYFVGSTPDTSRLSFLRTSLRTVSGKKITTFLLAREYAAEGNERRAIALLSSIGPLKSELLELQRQLRLARMYYTVGEFQRATIHFWQSMNYTNSEPFLFRIREWLHRCDWMTNPPPAAFERNDGELQSRWEGTGACGCEPYQAMFSPAISN